ncbi:MAG: isoprenylcysteine carboxylmethyltransferase family protein [Tabrizicola sp.]|nr:isoprenylcysteine carboxylmethyltransferase family protein [Tabrizicola sp.]
MGAAVVQMSLARTTVIPRRSPSALVTSGLFSLSRNPIYLGDGLILTGAILWLDAVLALPLLFSFVWLIQTRFIRDEETRLTEAFGPEFDLWAAHTRRWVGRK